MTKKIYGTMPDGRPVEAYTLDNGLLKAEILTYGATLNKLFVPDRNGVMENILLTFDSLEERLAGSQYQGEIVGRYANRIAKAQFTLNDKKYCVTLNEDNGNCLHGGGEFSHDLWRAAPVGESALELTFASPAGAHGFPGQVRVTVRYSLVGRSLAIKYGALSSADTVLNLTNHAYFNLAGEGSPSVLSHELLLHSSSYLEVDGEGIPTGRLLRVRDTPFDFRESKPINRDMAAEFGGVGGASAPEGYDHCFTVDGDLGKLRPCAEVRESGSGRRMRVLTTQPGVQFYTGNMLPDVRGKAGAVYSRHSGFCLETQHFPDSPNREDFPSCVFGPDRPYCEKSVFAFEID